MDTAWTELPTPTGDSSVRENPAEIEPDPQEPILVEVRKQGEDGLRIDIGGGRHSEIRIAGSTEMQIDDIVTCIREGIERAAAAEEGSLNRRLQGSGWWVRQSERHRVARRLDRIQQDCLHRALELDLPATRPPSFGS